MHGSGMHEKLALCLFFVLAYVSKIRPNDRPDLHEEEDRPVTGWPG